MSKLFFNAARGIYQSPSSTLLDGAGYWDAARGVYVGFVKSPKCESKEAKAEPKKEEPKKDSKKEEPKKDSKKEEPKKDSKKEDPKKDFKKDEPKIEEPKKEVKKEEPKKENKKGEPQKEAPKKEEPKPKEAPKKVEPEAKKDTKKVEVPKAKEEPKKAAVKPKEEEEEEADEEEEEADEEEADEEEAEEEDDDVGFLSESESDEETKALFAKTAKKVADIQKRQDARKGEAKTRMTLDVKPEDSDTDMALVEKKVRAIQIDGLTWLASSLIDVIRGVKKLRIMATLVDVKVNSGTVQEEIEAIEGVQSTDIVALEMA